MTIEFDVDKLYAGAKQMIAEEDVAREKRSGGVALFREKLSLKIGKEYLFRIVPYIKDGYENAMSKTFYRYYQYSWREADGGKWRYVTSPRTIGERCPIAEWRANYRRNASKEEVDSVNKKLGYKEGHYINVYVVNDPVNPENNGTVKILSCTRTVWKLIDDALRGELDSEWSEQRGCDYKVGPRVLDLTDEGLNLLVKVTESSDRAGMPDYSKSRFTPVNAALGWDAQKRNEVLASAHDLSKVERIMSSEDIADIFTKTFLPKVQGAPPVVVGDAPVVVKDDVQPASTVDESAVPTFTKPEQPVKDTQESVDSFIASLGIGNN